MFSLEGHTAGIQRCMFFNQNEQLLLTASLDGTLKVRHCSRSTLILITSCQISPENKLSCQSWQLSSFPSPVSCEQRPLFTKRLVNWLLIRLRNICYCEYCPYFLNFLFYRCGMYRMDPFSCLALTAVVSMSCLVMSLKTTRGCCQLQWIDMPR